VRAATVAALAWGLVGAWRLRWTCDDAFLSFRYARNLVRGHGLVFNVGERVEGYTNFLWTLLVAAGMELGIDPVNLANALGLAAFAGTLFLLVLLTRRSGGQGWLALPWAAAALALSRDAQVWATSGLETALFGGFLTLGVALLCGKIDARRAAFSGTAFVLAALTRPEGPLAYASTGLALFLLVRPGARVLLAFAAPALFLWLPWFLGRWSWYGWPFPNTYYAKSGHLAWWSQGGRYVTLFVRTNWSVLVTASVALALLPWAIRRARGAAWRAAAQDRAWLFALAAGAPLILYTARVGGDFMHARFLIPTLPLLLFAAEEGARVLAGEHRIWRFVPALLVVAACLRPDPFAGRGLLDGIADERSVYPPERLASARADGERIRRCIDGLPVVAAFSGAQAMLMYYADVPIAIEAETGLTDEFLAHRPLARRGRVGHEKQAPLSYLRARGVHLEFCRPLLPEQSITFSGVQAALATWDAQLMRELRARPGVDCIDIETRIDELLVRLPSTDTAEARAMYDFLRLFYFERNPDPARERPFRLKLGLPSLDGAARGEG
jgi:hypothetical protein